MSNPVCRANLYSVYVGNLHPDVTKEDIFKLFSNCGTIKDYVLLQNKDKEKQYGFVRYKNPKDAVQAIKDLNGWSVKSQKILVDLGHDTIHKMQKMEPQRSIPVNAISDCRAPLPVESHIDSVKNMGRVKKACVLLNTEASSYSDIVKKSRIITDLSKKGCPKIAWTIRDLNPRSVVNRDGELLDLSGKPVTRTSSVSQTQTESSNDDSVLEILHKLLKSTTISSSASKQQDKKNKICNSVLQKKTQDGPVSSQSKLTLQSKQLPTSLPEPTNHLSLSLSQEKYLQVGSNRDQSVEVNREESQTLQSGDHSLQVMSDIQLSKDPTSRYFPIESSIPNPAKATCCESSLSCVIKEKFATKNVPQYPMSSLSNGDSRVLETKSQLPLSVRNSRLARISGKSPVPQTRLVIPVPFLSPPGRSYSSEGSVSYESTSSLSS